MKGKRVAIVIGIVTMLTLILGVTGIAGTNQGEAQTADPWMVKPFLHYLLYTRDEKLEADVSSLKLTINLTEEEFNALREIAWEEYLKSRQIWEQGKDSDRASEKTLSWQECSKKRMIQYERSLDNGIPNSESGFVTGGLPKRNTERNGSRTRAMSRSKPTSPVT